jgi:hypothetical protein
MQSERVSCVAAAVDWDMTARMGARTVALVLVLVIATSGACGGGAGPTGGAAGAGVLPLIKGPPLTAADLCRAELEENCARDACGRGSPPCGMEDCVANGRCNFGESFTRTIAAGRLVFDGARAGDCHATFMANPCAVYPFPPSLFFTCQGAFIPNAHEGEPCMAYPECVAGLYCHFTATCPGHCKVLEPAGAHCGGPSDCAGGLTCDLPSQTCVPLSKRGGPCADSSSCTPPLVCHPTRKTCVDAGAVGAACSDALPPCQSNSWCDATGTTPGQCRHWSKAGESCHLFTCEPGLHCFGENVDRLGTCGERREEGRPCVEGIECRDGLNCSQGTCRLLSPGESCEEFAICAFGNVCPAFGRTCVPPLCDGAACLATGQSCTVGTCRDGRCTRWARLGEPCTSREDCASLLCEGGVCLDIAACHDAP